ncbi:MAG: cyclopropane-fatty-acyl-phospholipid synthase [Gammaproteobacteria bacterium]|nr:MAG: cyclopropane-fatty-acyl-phospholipid synthase [Gammaproteobacteria bacterium]
MQGPEHIAGVTTHARRGTLRNAFRYGVDYVLIDPEAPRSGPLLFSRNRFNLASVHDRDHGGPLGQGRGVAWLHEVLLAGGLDPHGLCIRLLTQPRYLGYSFNPVSFWLVWQAENLVAVVAEVSTPFGDRHSYLCHRPGFAPITRDTRIDRPKALHVSPFQQVAGSYRFGFDIRPERIAIRIDFRNGPEGLVATLSGPRARLTNRSLLGASMRRPLGALRTIILIHWQALRLKLKGARYRKRPEPPDHEVT